jgi:hypothetical protein
VGPQRIAATADLLKAVFPTSDANTEGYLDWLYRQNPAGQVVEANEWDAQGMLAHYAVVPQKYSRGGAAPEVWGLSLNTATSDRARGKGLFTKLARETYVQASERGLKGVIGVANANSTPGFLRKLDFQLVGPLEAKVGLTLPRASSRVRNVSAEHIKPEDFAAIAQADRRRADSGLAQAWDADLLKWRLSTTRGPLCVHLHDAGPVLVTRRVTLNHLSVAVLLGTFGLASGKMSRQLIASALWHWRAPAYIYGGHNNDFPVRGMPVPRRLRPSPLNLIWRDLSGEGSSFSMEALRRFEFIDFDPY